MGFDRVGCFPCLAGGDYWKPKRLLLMILVKTNVLKLLQLAHEVKKNVFTNMKWSRKNLDLMVQTNAKANYYMMICLMRPA